MNTAIFVKINVTQFHGVTLSTYVYATEYLRKKKNIYWVHRPHNKMQPTNWHIIQHSKKEEEKKVPLSDLLAFQH